MGRGEYYKNKYGGGGRGGGRGRGGGGGGRGEYYKNKYGGGGRGGGGEYEAAPPPPPRAGGGGGGGRAQPAAALAEALRRVDGRPYGAYKDLGGSSYRFGGPEEGGGGGAGAPAFTLTVDRVQSDPFAPPSRFHVVVPASSAQFPPECFQSKIRQIALCDYLTRTFHYNAKMFGADKRTESGGWGGAKGGEVLIDGPGQHVLERTSVLLRPEPNDEGGGGGGGGGGYAVEARFTVALPARGRSICGGWARQILTETLPRLVRQSLCAPALDADKVLRHLRSVEDQEALRGQLRGLGLVGFVRDGAVLPRASGDADTPMQGPGVVAFASPAGLRVEAALPNAGPVTGMGIRPGVTLIVGGGFHGKSTLLQALEVGVYNHIPGDGREFVTVDPTAVKIRAEDGRCVLGTNISPFIDNLPFGKDTTSFSTPDASGSTSQAANIAEALEAGARTLLVDEDTCATNFMIRDTRMQMLVAKDKEPITPFIAKVRALYEQLGVSSVLVIGGAGDYFDVADAVVMMDCYAPQDVTARAKEIAALHSGNGAATMSAPEYGPLSVRAPQPAAYAAGGGKVVARGLGKLQYGEIDIDLGAVEQLVEVSQTRAIGDAIKLLAQRYMDGRATLQEVLDALEGELDARGLDALGAAAQGGPVGNHARPRRFEVAAALNRYRNGQMVAVPSR